MGVRGLTGLIKDNPRIYMDLLLREGRVVVDGCSLLFELYFKSDLDQNLGGEYVAFEEVIENFIASLRTCGISPFIVLDGGQDVSGKKLQTLDGRAKDRIQRANQAAVEGSQEQILPLLASLVFKQTLVKLEVPMAVCYEEADHEIAALANEWNCPVLSSDSDFYIFDIPAGMLPLPHFQWRVLEQRKTKSFIPCKTYRTSSFCSFFGIQKQLLPTFAALAGNDFVTLNSCDWNKFSSASVKKNKRLWGLLYWLKPFYSSEEAVEAFLNQMAKPKTKQQQQTMQESLYFGIWKYELSPSCLKKFFVHRIPPPFPEASGVVPEWIQSGLVKGEITSKILDVLRLQSRRLNVAVGLAGLPSAHGTSKPLRQVMYGLLVPHRQVQEMDRVGLHAKEIGVQPIITATLKDCGLLSLPKVKHCQRLQALMEALDLNKATLSCLPSELHLPVAVTCYWWQKARPTPDLRLLKALLLGLSIGTSQNPIAALFFQRSEFDLSHLMAHNVNQWQSCLKECIYLNQLLGHPLAHPHISRLYNGALVHHLIQRMMSGKLKNFFNNDVSRVDQYKKMLAVVRPFDYQQPRRRRAFHQGHQPKVKKDVVDVWRLFDQEETGAAVRTLKNVDLDHMVSLKVRHTTKDRKRSNSNPMIVCKMERRGKDLI